MKRYQSLIVLLLIVATLALTGCGGRQSAPAGQQTQGTASGGTQKATTPTKVTIQIDGAAVPYYAPLYVAKEKGYFTAQGVEVDFMYASAADIVKNVAAGNVEFGFPNADSVITARAQGIPVKVVHTTYQHGLGATIFKSGKGIEKPADLKGKRIAVTSLGSPNYIQLQVLLKKNNLSLNDVKVEIVGTGAIVQALADDKVDAIVFSMLRTIELKSQGVDAREFRSDDFLPSFGNVLIASDKLVKEQPDLAKRFIAGLNKGIEDIIKGEPRSAVDLAVEKYTPTFKGREEVVTRILREVFIPYLWQSEYTKQNGLGAADLQRWQRSIGVLAEYKVIEKPFDAKDLVVTGL